VKWVAGPARSTPAHVPRFPNSASYASGFADSVFTPPAEPALRHGTRMYPLHVGDTYLEPLAAAQAEAQHTQQHPRLHNYAPVQGERELLDAIQRKLARCSGVEVERACIQVMSGATAAMGVIANALLMPGDEVLVPAPFWPLVRGAVSLRGAKCIEVPVFTRLREPGFDPVAALAAQIGPRTVALYINSPHNPTGETLSDEVAAGIVALAREHDLWLLTDEVYEDVWFGDAPPRSIWALPEARDRTIATHSVSKAYGLAGARVGYSHGPLEIMRVIRGVQTFFTYCAPRPMQLGAARALDEGDAWLAQARSLYADAARSAARALGVPVPAGGTFVFFDTRAHRRPGETAQAFLARCVAAGVVLTPGVAAGQAYADWARLCFTSVPPDELACALDCLRSVLAPPG
jgi:N-succinyldiaminopimelate aminotransferase